MTSRYGDYVVAFYDANGVFIGYFAEDPSSGGYPYISDSTRQASTLNKEAAIKEAEGSFTCTYYGFWNVDSAVIGKLQINKEFVLTRRNYKDVNRQREVQKRLEEIAKLQEEIDQIKGEIKGE